MKQPTKECPHCHKHMSAFGLIYAKHVADCYLKHTVTAYADGHYILVSPSGIDTPTIISNGVVFISNGFAGGNTGKRLEYFLAQGFTAVHGTTRIIPTNNQ